MPVNVLKVRRDRAGRLAAAGNLHHDFGRAPHCARNLRDLLRGETHRAAGTATAITHKVECGFPISAGSKSVPHHDRVSTLTASRGTQRVAKRPRSYPAIHSKCSETSHQLIAAVVSRLSTMLPTHPHTARRGKRICNWRIAGFTPKPCLDLARENGSLPSRDNVP